MPSCSPLPSPFRLRDLGRGAEGMNRRGRGGGGEGGSKGLSWEWLLKFLSVSVSVRGLQLLYQCHRFIQCLYSPCRR